MTEQEEVHDSQPPQPQNAEEETVASNVQDVESDSIMNPSPVDNELSLSETSHTDSTDVRNDSIDVTEPAIEENGTKEPTVNTPTPSEDTNMQDSNGTTIDQESPKAIPTIPVATEVTDDAKPVENNVKEMRSANLAIRESNASDHERMAELSQLGDPYDGRKTRNRLSQYRALPVGHYRFAPDSFVVKNVLKQLKDEFLVFNAEVSRITQHKAHHNRILLITDNHFVTMTPKDMKLKAISNLDKMAKISVSELDDNFIFIHFDGDTDYLFRTNRKTELIQVLQSTLFHRNKKDLEVDVTNEIQYAHKRPDDKTLVSFAYHDLTKESKAIDGAHIQIQKDKVLVHIQEKRMDPVVLESVFIEVLDEKSDTVKDRFEINTANNETCVNFPSKDTFYRSIVRFHLFSKLEEVTLLEKISSATGDELYTTKFDVLDPQEQGHKAFTVKVPDRRKVKFSRVSKIAVQMCLYSKDKVFFNIQFQYQIKPPDKNQGKSSGGAMSSRLNVLKTIFKKGGKSTGSSSAST